MLLLTNPSVGASSLNNVYRAEALSYSIVLFDDMLLWFGPTAQVSQVA